MITAQFNHLIEDCIEDNLGKRITLVSIAQQCHISPYYLHRCFSAFHHETFAQYVTRIKMERAYMIIRTNPLISLTDVALTYGYSDLSSFSKAFKRIHKLSPNQARKQE
ncbi:MAG: helix-turn-helix transcriptional regulator [Erysipelothrix sp.]|nr:helix-turn-helix transcriptional regulator [Erysipelothrix sp.]